MSDFYVVAIPPEREAPARFLSVANKHEHEPWRSTEQEATPFSSEHRAKTRAQDYDLPPSYEEVARVPRRVVEAITWAEFERMEEVYA